MAAVLEGMPMSCADMLADGYGRETSWSLSSLAFALGEASLEIQEPLRRRSVRHVARCGEATLGQAQARQ